MSTYKIGWKVFVKEAHERVVEDADNTWSVQKFSGDQVGERLLPTDPTITRVVHNTGEYTAYVYHRRNGAWKCLYQDNSPH
jgi:hypothetical protein